MQLTVNERVNFLISSVTGGNKAAFAKSIGVGAGVIQDIIGGRLNKPSFDVLNKIVNAYPDLNIEWLVTGEGAPFKPDMKTDKPEALEAVPILEFGRGVEKRHESQDIPLYDITAAAGLNALYNSQNNILDYMRIPNLPRCDGAIYVKGDSMYPLLKHGDMVAFQQITDYPEDIIFGEMYVIDISTANVERIVVKYLQPSPKGEDYIRLISYNEKHHPPKDIALSKVKALAVVKASVRLS